VSLVVKNLLAICPAMIAVACLQGGCDTRVIPVVVPVEGQVTLDGKPLPKAQVRFIPAMEVGPEFIGTAVTDEQGRFVLQSDGRPGAAVGAHQVVISESDPPAELLNETKQRELAAYMSTLKNRPIPPKYSSPVGSGISVTVVDGQQPLTIELSR
jgi:hypothetical protein